MSLIINCRTFLVSFFILVSPVASSCSKWEANGDSHSQFSLASEESTSGLNSMMPALTPFSSSSLISSVGSMSESPIALKKGIVTVGDTSWSIEVADTPGAQGMGLSGRDSLHERSGMLFMFDQSLSAKFWMVGMKFPLDFIWISERCVVLEIVSDAPILTTAQERSIIPTYGPSVPSKYTLEINAGEASRYNVQPGDKVRLEGIKSSGC